MRSIESAARRAGWLYVVFSIVPMVSEFAFPRFVTGDAAATAQNIASPERLFRLHIATTFATLILHIYTVAALYELLKRVDKEQSRVMVLLVAVGVSVAIANTLHRPSGV